MTAPFTVDVGDSQLSVDPGPWGVTVHVSERWGQPTGIVQSQDARITLDADQATRLAAALILAAATVTSYDREASMGCPPQ